MQRHPLLQPLSDDHHAALVLARRLKRFAGPDDSLELKALSRDVLHAFEMELAPHFEIEERWLVPALEVAGESHLAGQILDQHTRLRELFSSRWTSSLAAELGDCLEKHVRFEERVVFPAAERLLPIESMEAIRDAVLSYRAEQSRSASCPDRPASPDRPDGAKTVAEPPGGTVLWIFVALELLTFILLFIALASARRADPATFAAGTAQLHAFLGAVNTCVLLTGGLFAALGVIANARNEARSTSLYLWSAALSGVVFMAIKLYEYADAFSAGVTLSTNSFWFFYLFVTGLHFLHVLAGVLFLVPTAWRASRGAYGTADSTPVEAVAVFWHLVDLIWVFVFPLFYLVHRA